MAALLYMVTEELLVSAHEDGFGHTWWVDIQVRIVMIIYHYIVYNYIIIYASLGLGQAAVRRRDRQIWPRSGPSEAT